MSVLTQIFGGGLADIVREVVRIFRLPPEKQAEIEQKIRENEHVLRLKELEIEARLADYQAREMEAASANIRAEAQSGDSYTRRARPTFLYVVNFILIWNYIIAPLLGAGPLNLPEPLFWLFGAGLLGYTGARTWEKVYSLRNGSGSTR